MSYGSGYGLGTSSGTYGYNNIPSSSSWQSNPSISPWTGWLPSYWFTPNYGATTPSTGDGPGNNFNNHMPLSPVSGSDPERSTGSVSPGDRVGDTSPIDDMLPAGDYGYQQVGTIDRAPMAMFEHNGELLISAVTRNGINETPIWSYSENTGVIRRGELPEHAESGHYGFSFGDGFHITPESWDGPTDYVAYSPDGPYIQQDYTYLVPHAFKNLKWGFSYVDEGTGRQFMGFGNAGHPGMVITYEGNDWKLFSAPDDMRFPTGLGVITGGERRRQDPDFELLWRYPHP